MMSSMLYMADPSDLVGSKYSEDILNLAVSETHISLLGLELCSCTLPLDRQWDQ